MDECPLRVAVSRYGDIPAIVAPDVEWTFADWDAAADESARRFYGKHLVSLSAPVSAQYAADIFGALRAGADVFTIRENQTPYAPPLPAEGFVTARQETRAPFLLIQTSGSTAAPKLAALTSANFVTAAEFSNANIPFVPGDAWLLSLPLYHVGGLSILFRALGGGGTVIIPENRKNLKDTLQDFRVTHLSVVPTQLIRLLKEETDFSRLKAILIGGAPIAEKLVNECIEQGLPIHTTYGMTETASQVCTTPPDASREALLTAGPPLIPDTVCIKGGEIHVRGGALFAGYVKRGTLCPATDGAGWFATGDWGQWDNMGRLIVTGRRDNQFVCGGENIQPEALEAVLSSHPAVDAVIVVPKPDAEWGAVPVAFVRWCGASQFEALKSFSDKHLPRHARPRAWLDWPADLDTHLLKASRVQLRNLAL